MRSRIPCSGGRFCGKRPARSTTRVMTENWNFDPETGYVTNKWGEFIFIGGVALVEGPLRKDCPAYTHARLFAAAPRLLESCRTLARNASMQTVCEKDIVEAQRAISAAEGDALEEPAPEPEKKGWAPSAEDYKRLEQEVGKLIYKQHDLWRTQRAMMILFLLAVILIVIFK